MIEVLGNLPSRRLEEEGWGRALCEIYLSHVTKRGHEARVMVKDRDLDTEEEELDKVNKK